MRAHHRFGTRRDGRAERHQLTGVQRVEVRHRSGQGVVGIHVGVAVSGEVLGAGGDSGGLETFDVRDGVAGGERGVGAEGPDTDDRVVGVGVDVRGRRPVEVDPAFGESAAQFTGDGPGEVRVVHRAQRVVAGEGGAGAYLQAGDVSALLVDRDEHVVPLGPQLCGEGRELIRREDIAAEQADGREAFTDPAEQPVGGGGADEARLEDREGVTRQGVCAYESCHGDGVIPSLRRPSDPRPFCAGRGGRGSRWGWPSSWRPPSSGRTRCRSWW